MTPQGLQRRLCGVFYEWTDIILDVSPSICYSYVKAKDFRGVSP